VIASKFDLYLMFVAAPNGQVGRYFALRFQERRTVMVLVRKK